MKNNKYLASVQFESRAGDLVYNTNKIIEKIKQLKSGTAIAVFPEMCLYGYSFLEKLSVISQNDINLCLKNIAEECIKNDVEIILGGPYYKDDVIENSLYYVKDHYKKVYSKNHLIKFEKQVFSESNELSIIDTSVGRAGLMICWDTAFPCVAETYALNYADYFISCAAWEKPYGLQWRTAVCARSLDNSTPIISSNMSGNCFEGQSIITDSNANIIAVSQNNEEIIYADVESFFKKDKYFGFPLLERHKHYKLKI